MLAFIDQDSHIKVVKIDKGENGEAVREKVGTIRKKDLMLDESLAALQQDDGKKITEMVRFMEKQKEAKLVAALYTLPTMLRETVAYAVRSGTSFENEVLLAALLEALRVMRKAERDQIATNGDATTHAD